MRQMIVQVPRGKGQEITEIARKHRGVNLSLVMATSDERDIDLVTAYIPNRQVEDFLARIQEVAEIHVTLLPVGAMVLRPPAEEAAEQVTNIEERSPIEVFLSGLQSVGSWRGFLSYAAIAGVVVWIGLYTNTIYLLVAAMLIAPFASPAMNLAIGTARGDITLIARSLRRYFAALGVTIAISALLSFLFRQQIPTSLMFDTGEISSTAILLPLAAGAAGAINLVQSERSSLVSGAATGMLVAASLAPPAGIVGMALALGRWEMVKGGLFLLFLQLGGINLVAGVLFRVFGLSTRGSRYDRGKRRVFPIALFLTALLLTGLLVWQLWNPPSLQRSSLSQRATAEVTRAIERLDSVELVEADIRFTSPDIPGQNTLLGTIYVRKKPNSDRSSEELRDLVTRTVKNQLRAKEFNATPLVNVTVLD